MGGNNNKNQTGYGANAGQSSSNDPKGRMQNSAQYQQQRYESQQGPMADAMGYNYGRGTEADYGNYTDMMNQYRDIASGSGSGGGSGGSGGGGGGGSSFSAHTVNPMMVSAERSSTRALNPLERTTAQKAAPIERVSAKDPYESYKGFQDFSQTGGYSQGDVNNMRARGVAPIRAAYANAERGIGQQRSLQGGYSPNAIAAQVKMAREQGQSMADANQNVEADLAEMKQRGRLSGLQGMSGIESDRLAAQMQGDIFNAGQQNQTNQFDITNDLQNQQFNSSQALEGQIFDIGNELSNSQFNAGQGNQVGMYNSGLDFQGQQYNADAMSQADARNAASSESAANRSYQANQDDMNNRFAALAGMQNLYGTTPGMSNMFGEQLYNAVGQGGDFGLGLMQEERLGQALPGQYEQTMSRGRDVANTIGQYATPVLDYFNDRNKPQQTTTQTNGRTGSISPSSVSFGQQPSGTQQRTTNSGLGRVRF